jgi:hypothetical protein
MAVDYEAQNTALRDAATAHSSSIGAALLGAIELQAELLISWVGYLRSSVPSDATPVLLNGVHAALVETAGCLALGLVRPALFSLRAQIDMAMGWLYFKDHPIEWRHSQRTSGEAKLRGEVVKYLPTLQPRFQDRYKLLAKNRKRTAEEPYGLLSAHVHSLTSLTIPPLGKLADLISTQARCEECVNLQGEVSEYLSDSFLACFAERWQDLPEIVRANAKGRLSEPQLKDLVKQT